MNPISFEDFYFIISAIESTGLGRDVFASKAHFKSHTVHNTLFDKIYLKSIIPFNNGLYQLTMYR